MKEFVAASNEEKKSIFTKIEDEVDKLKGFTARYYVILYQPKSQSHDVFWMIKLPNISKKSHSALCYVLYH